MSSSQRWLTLALLTLTLGACEQEPSTPAPASADAGVQAQGPTTPDATSARTDLDTGWTALLISTESAFGAPGPRLLRTDGEQTLSVGVEIPVGATLVTGPHTRARIQTRDGALLTLNHSTTLELVAGAPRSAKLSRGQLLVELTGAAPATLQLPGHTLQLEGAKLSAYAGEQGAQVTVARGQVGLPDGKVQARAGDELRFSASGEPSRTHTPSLAAAMGWSTFDDEPVTVPRGLGQLYGQNPGGGTQRPLDLTEHHVDVRIQGPMAYTEVTEAFHNDTSRTLEGIYRFPLPEGAQISRLSLLVGSKWQEGVFVENKRAEQIWREVIRDWRDPAWLKWQHGNQFELRIFPIDPGATRKIIIGYTQRLEPTADGRRYVYPMPVDEEGVTRAGQFTFGARIQGHDTTSSVRIEGYEAEQSLEEDTTIVQFGAKDFAPAGDVGLRFALEKGEKTWRAATYRNPKRAKDPGYLMVALRPELPQLSDVEGRDFLIVADTSYTRQGKAWDIQNKLIARFVREMDPLDRVAVIACAGTCQPVGEGAFAAPGEARAAKIQTALTTLVPRGTSNLAEAISVSAAVFNAREAQARTRGAHLVMLTEGLPSSGPLDPGPLAAKTREMLAPLEPRTTLVDLGGNADPLVLQAVARASSGTVLALDPGEPLGASALRILGRHTGPMLADIRLELPPGVEAVHPAEPTSLPAGGELVVLGRLAGPVQGDLVLRGTVAGKAFEQRVPLQLTLNESPGNAFIPRLWAEQQIAALELDEETDHQPEIVALSLEHGLLSRHTSLLALESEDMRREFGLDRDRSLPVWTGDEEASESSDAKDKARNTRSKKPKTKRRSPAKKSPPKLDNAGGLDDPFLERKPRPTGKRPRHRKPRWRATIKAFKKAPDTAKRVEQLRAKMAKEPDSRQHRKALIRNLARADRLEEARKEADAWLQRNPFDPEALILAMEIDLREGHVAEAHHRLASAVDVSPRAEWLQERLVDAFERSGDHARACAQRQSLFAVTGKKKDAPKSPCGLASDMSRFGVTTPATRGEPVSTPSTSSSRQIHAKLEWEGDADLDLVLVEPSGRALSWLGGSSRFNTGPVRGQSPESFTLRKPRSGTYQVEVVRYDDGSEPINATLTLRSLGADERFDLAVGPGRTAVAHVKLKN